MSNSLSKVVRMTTCACRPASEDNISGANARANILIGFTIQLALILCPVYAQSPPQHNSKVAVPQSKDDVDEFETKKLNSAMELPYLPEFPQKTFLRGMAKPNTSSGPSYIMYFSVKQPPAEVLTWYETSFLASKWKPKQKMKHMIDMIHPEGHKCIVTAQYMPPVYDESTKKFRSDTKISIYFHTKWK
jgi:hypothetical protein